MAKVTILVDQTEDTVKSVCDLEKASLADLTIIERILRRYLVQVIEVANQSLDQSTSSGKKVALKVEDNTDF